MAQVRQQERLRISNGSTSTSPTCASACCAARRDAASLEAAVTNSASYRDDSCFSTLVGTVHRMQSSWATTVWLATGPDAWLLLLVLMLLALVAPVDGSKSSWKNRTSPCLNVLVLLLLPALLPPLVLPAALAVAAGRKAAMIKGKIMAIGMDTVSITFPCTLPKVESRMPVPFPSRTKQAALPDDVEGPDGLPGLNDRGPRLEADRDKSLSQRCHYRQFHERPGWLCLLQELQVAFFIGGGE